MVQQITALHLLPKLSALQHHLACANIIYNHQFITYSDYIPGWLCIASAGFIGIIFSLKRWSPYDCAIYTVFPAVGKRVEPCFHVRVHEEQQD